MKNWTYLELKTKIQRDMDLEAEDFVQPEELRGYINEAIDEAETHIHTLGLEDDYFLTSALLPLVSGEGEISLPTDIYANKIRAFVYDDNSLIYEIKRVRGQNIFNKVANFLHYSNSSDYYQYIMVNRSATAGSKIFLVPRSRETTATRVTLWYIRNANELLLDTDVCDIPEFEHFVIKYTKFMIYYKEGHPNMQIAKQELEQQRTLMVETLSNMVPDQDSEIVPDLTMYTDTI